MPKTPTSNLGDQIDILTIGDCSIDLMLKVPDNASEIEQLNGITGAQPKMCFYHGSKIMVESFSTSISGNSVNVATGTALLGLKTAIYTETGADANADKISEELKGFGVDTSLLIKNKGIDTALHAVIIYSGERTIFSYHGKRHYSIKNWGKPKFIYYSSLGEDFEKFQSELVEHVKKSKVGLAFNPGTFQMARGVDSLTNVLAVTDILFVNKEEAQRLTKSPAGSDTMDLHKKLLAFGVKLGVITDGKNGASAYDRVKLFTQTAFIDNRKIVDMTGAGDAFSAGFIAAIIYGKNLQEALAWGTTNSAAQIKVVGSVGGMLTRTQLEKLIKL